MAEVVMFLLWRSWWWCLAACLAAAGVAPAAVEAAAAAAAGQGQCEVLDLSLPSIFSLPINLTLKPTAPRWLLDFILLEGEAPPSACVRLQETESKVQVMLFKGGCGTGKTEKSSYLPDASVPPHAWTTLALDVKDNAVVVTTPNSVSIPLKADGWSLPRDALHVTVANSIDVAVGCRVNCPLYRHASEGPNKQKTVKKSCQDNLIFYFLPGEEFVRLEYEVTCTSMIVIKEILPITYIVPDHLYKGMWYFVELQHLDGEVEVQLDFKHLKTKLLTGCAHIEHTIRLVGDSHFSFSCNPSTGVAEGVEDDSWDCSYNKQYESIEFLLVLLVFLACILIVSALRCLQFMVTCLRKAISPIIKAVGRRRGL